MVLVAHMYFLSFLRLGKKILDILDVDKGPCEVVVLSDDFETGYLCGETGGAVEISNFWFNTGDLVEIVDHFHCIWTDVVENFKVGENFSC